MTTHPSLRGQPANLIAGEWQPVPGDALTSTKPFQPTERVWSGSPTPIAVAPAVDAAQNAQSEWAQRPLSARLAVLQRFVDVVEQHKQSLATLIADEVGKVRWDAEQEVAAVIGKVKLTLDSAHATDTERTNSGLTRTAGFTVPITDTREGRCWFRPHGVMAVVGPFNFPAHLPNGHIVPALSLGNTVVFKPSDKTPAVGQMLAEMLDDALRAESAPPGVVNLVQGGADVARELTTHPGINGILFTGSWPVGRKILEANLDRPGCIVALELGGNNPAIVMDDADLRQAVIECARASFITTGQRCTCTRRIIVHETVADRFIAALTAAAKSIAVAHTSDDDAFMGPMVSADARDAVLEAQAKFIAAGGESILACQAPDRDGHFITPGIMRVPGFRADDEGPSCDQEVFGPLVRITTVNSLDDTIAQANATRFGLAASIFTQDAANIQRFLAEAQAGCVNVNTGTAGASSKLPFGGLGFSGNHRPAGAFSADYCAYPVAGLVESGTGAAVPTGMSFDDAWITS
ncbi:MAG: aldehyde dehydrogenase family protein [Planctomycetota bacterium]